MGLPWTTIKNTNVFHNEYEQSSVPNRCFNRLLDNDKYLKSIIENISASAIPIEFANDVELEALQLSGKAIWTDNIMVVSATSGEMLSGGNDDRFVTATGNQQVLGALATGISFIDLVHLGFLDVNIDVDVLSTSAKEILGDFAVPDGTKIEVQFLFEEAVRAHGSKSQEIRELWYLGYDYTTGRRGRHGHRWHFPKVARYMYEVTGDVWVYLGRIMNAGRRLNE